MKVGKPGSARVVVSGSRPFRVLGVSGTGDGVSVDIPEGAAKSHILTVRWQPTMAGTIRKQLTIRTNLDGAAATVSLDGSASPE